MVIIEKLSARRDGDESGGISLEQLWRAIGGRVKGDYLTRLGAMGDGKKAREGLMRALLAHKGVGAARRVSCGVCGTCG